MKIQGQGHGQGQTNGYILGLEFNWYVCFSFCGDWTIFGWDIANSKFDLENGPKSNQVILRSGPSILPKMKEIKKIIAWTKVCVRRQWTQHWWWCMNRYKNIKSSHILGWFNYLSMSQLWLNHVSKKGPGGHVHIQGIQRMTTHLSP